MSDIRIPRVGDRVRSDYGVSDIEGEVVAVEPYESEVGPNAVVTVAWKPAASQEYAQDIIVLPREENP